jgi:SAM-dependent methyltransferase
LCRTITAHRSWLPARERHYYYPPFWEETSDKKIIRESDIRLNTILKDIVSLEGRNVLEIGCATGYFSNAVNQIPAIRVTSVDIDAKFIEIMKVRKALTGYPSEIIHGTVRDVKRQFDATLFIDVFFQILTNAGVDEAKYQFERICELTKHRIYFGFGHYPTSNKFGIISDYYRRTLSKYGFNNIEMIYYGRDEEELYRRPIFVAKKG